MSMAVVAATFSGFAEPLANRIGLKKVWAACLFTAGCMCLFIQSIVHSVHGVVLCVCMYVQYAKFTVMHAVALISTPLIKHVETAIAVHSLIGFGLAAAFTYPWTIVTLYSLLYDPKRAGLWGTLFNVGEAIPAILVAVIAGRIVTLANGSVGTVIFFGGVSMITGAFLVFRVKKISHGLEYESVTNTETTSGVLSPRPPHSPRFEDNDDDPDTDEDLH